MSEDNILYSLHVLASTAHFPLRLMLEGSDIATKTVSSKIILLSIGLMSGIIWSHYSTDLMARMTFAPQTQSEIRSFQDVIDGNLKVVTYDADGAGLEFLKSSNPLSVKFKYYNDNMDGNSNAFVENLDQAKDILLQQENTLFYGPDLDFIEDDRDEIQQIIIRTLSGFHNLRQDLTY
jgi:hypothetical protein